MDKLERFAYWKSVAVDSIRAADPDGAAYLEAREWKDEENLFGLFGCFRPDGRGVEKAFAGVVGGDEIVQRLLRVYACTRESFFNRDMYFIVRRAAPATRDRLVDLTMRHLDKVRQIAISFCHAELADLLETRPQIRITHEPAPDRKLPDPDAPETSIYYVCCDWFRDLEPIQSDVLLMREAKASGNFGRSC